MNCGRVFALLLAVLAVAAAQAQFRRTSASLGSEGPSQFLGRVGGQNTSYVPITSGSRSFDAAGAGVPRFSAVGGRGGELGRGNSVFRRSGLGFGQGNPSARYGGVRRGMINDQEMRDISYMTLATSFNLQRGLVSAPDTTQVRSPLFLEEPKSDYHRYFGLASADASGRPPMDRDVPDELKLVARVERIARNTEAQRAIGAERVFRAAMTRPSPERVEKLAAAMSLLSNVRRGTGGAEPALMYVCAAMLRGQNILAAEYLLYVAEQYPETFAELPDLRARCEEPAVLEELAQRVMLTDYSTSRVPEDLIVQVFSAWLLKDRQRTQAALDAANTRFAGNALEPRVQKFLRAFEYALQQAAQ